MSDEYIDIGPSINTGRCALYTRTSISTLRQLLDEDRLIPDVREALEAMLGDAIDAYGDVPHE